MQSGVPLFVIAKLLGHRSTAMVERHAGHLAASNFTDAAATLPERRGAAPVIAVVDATQ